ncbi:hypothetical protein Enr10x_52490 [Gimesia panareensis]|uniref:Thoeris protein ThsB TIR-like domain-containing protein n=1 Tax=Gimesia panareensis TaxID=2527978 RepID=A0A517QE27_9PLAN|nr:TIR domain-containing protein [Gimesia panareensis]QDT29892.1 hypothetical protein Enr10x_52490 [Gimesia panareensis]
MSTNYPYNPLSYSYGSVTRPKIFVSYHHASNQHWYDAFSQIFGTYYEVITDTSLDRQIDSDNSDYVKRAIREKNITGSSVTIVLCGQETHKRRWVDWEIEMTLKKKHALLGIMLTSCARNFQNEYIIPDRLLDNINSGYASWIDWTNSPQVLMSAIAEAKDRAGYTSRIDNHRPAMQRSKS